MTPAEDPNRPGAGAVPGAVPDLKKALGFAFIVSLILASISCGGPGTDGGGGARPAAIPGPRYALAAREIVSEMTLEEKCAQLLMISLGGARAFPPGFAAALEDVPVGGILFLGANIASSSEKIVEFTSSLQTAALRTRTGIPLFLAVDHEGGEVFRFGKVMTPLPSAAAAARLGREEAAARYLRSAFELAALGFSMNFAPLLETRLPENADFLRTRTYSDDPAVVAAVGGIFAEALRRAGVAAVGKHFPGCGDGDPHRSLPKAEGFGDGTRDRRLFAFKDLISKGLLPGVMVSHVLVPAVDPDRPATLSSRVQRDLLRKELAFEGIVVSDDLNMRGLAEVLPPADAAVEAVRAGTDLLMYLPSDYPKIRAALADAVRSGALDKARVDEAAARIVRAKLETGLWISARKLKEERKALEPVR